MKFDWLFKVPVAHRGLHDDELPENSMPAFAAAIEHGFNIEIDVHLSSDGHLVVFHDDNLKRVCGIDKKVKDCTVEELTKTHLYDTEFCIPTFDEFLELVNGQVGILCEIKGLNPADTSIAAAVCERVKSYKGDIALQSFNFGAVAYCKKHSDRPSGQLCTWRNPKGTKRSHLTDFMGKLWVTKLSDPDFIAYDIRDLDANKYVVKARKKVPVITWTINTPEKLATAHKYADNIIFETIGSLVAQEYSAVLKDSLL